MTYVYTARTGRITIFSTGGKFQPVWSYTSRPFLPAWALVQEMNGLGTRLVHTRYH